MWDLNIIVALNEKAYQKYLEKKKIKEEKEKNETKKDKTPIA